MASSLSKAIRTIEAQHCTQTLYTLNLDGPNGALRPVLDERIHDQLRDADNAVDEFSYDPALLGKRGPDRRC